MAKTKKQSNIKNTYKPYNAISKSTYKNSKIIKYKRNRKYTNLNKKTKLKTRKYVRNSTLNNLKNRKYNKLNHYNNILGTQKGGVYNILKHWNNMRKFKSLIENLHKEEKDISKYMGTYQANSEIFKTLVEEMRDKTTEYILNRRQVIISDIIKPKNITFSNDKKNRETQKQYLEYVQAVHNKGLGTSKLNRLLTDIEKLVSKIKERTSGFNKDKLKFENKTKKFRDLIAKISDKNLGSFQSNVLILKKEYDILSKQSENIKKEDKKIIKKYKKHEADYDKVASVTETYIDEQQKTLNKINELLQTTNFYKDTIEPLTKSKETMSKEIKTWEITYKDIYNTIDFMINKINELKTNITKIEELEFTNSNLIIPLAGSTTVPGLVSASSQFKKKSSEIAYINKILDAILKTLVQIRINMLSEKLGSEVYVDSNEITTASLEIKKKLEAYNSIYKNFQTGGNYDINLDQDFINYNYNNNIYRGGYQRGGYQSRLGGHTQIESYNNYKNFNNSNILKGGSGPSVLSGSSGSSGRGRGRGRARGHGSSTTSGSRVDNNIPYDFKNQYIKGIQNPDTFDIITTDLTKTLFIYLDSFSNYKNSIITDIQDQETYNKYRKDITGTGTSTDRNSLGIPISDTSSDKSIKLEFNGSQPLKFVSSTKNNEDLFNMALSNIYAFVKDKQITKIYIYKYESGNKTNISNKYLNSLWATANNPEFITEIKELLTALETLVNTNNNAVLTPASTTPTPTPPTSASPTSASPTLHPIHSVPSGQLQPTAHILTQQTANLNPPGTGLFSGPSHSILQTPNKNLSLGANNPQITLHPITKNTDFDSITKDLDKTLFIYVDDKINYQNGNNSNDNNLIIKYRKYRRDIDLAGFKANDPYSLGIPLTKETYTLDENDFSTIPTEITNPTTTSYTDYIDLLTLSLQNIYYFIKKNNITDIYYYVKIINEPYDITLIPSIAISTSYTDTFKKFIKILEESYTVTFPSPQGNQAITTNPTTTNLNKNAPTFFDYSMSDSGITPENKKIINIIKTALESQLFDSNSNLADKDKKPITLSQGQRFFDDNGFIINHNYNGAFKINGLTAEIRNGNIYIDRNKPENNPIIQTISNLKKTNMSDETIKTFTDNMTNIKTDINKMVESTILKDLSDKAQNLSTLLITLRGIESKVIKATIKPPDPLAKQYSWITKPVEITTGQHLEGADTLRKLINESKELTKSYQEIATITDSDIDNLANTLAFGNQESARHNVSRIKLIPKNKQQYFVDKIISIINKSNSTQNKEKMICDVMKNISDVSGYDSASEYQKYLTNQNHKCNQQHHKKKT